jgi:hypothetical protein
MMWMWFYRRNGRFTFIFSNFLRGNNHYKWEIIDQVPMIVSPGAFIGHIGPNSQRGLNLRPPGHEAEASTINPMLVFSTEFASH